MCSYATCVIRNSLKNFKRVKVNSLFRGVTFRTAFLPCLLSLTPSALCSLRMAGALTWHVFLPWAYARAGPLNGSAPPALCSLDSFCPVGLQPGVSNSGPSSDPSALPGVRSSGLSPPVAFISVPSHCSPSCLFSSLDCKACESRSWVGLVGCLISSTCHLAEAQ